MSKNYIFEPELGVVKTNSFSEVYPIINRYLMENKEWENCRDGNVKEILDFKTINTNPYRRLVGGYCRNENPFFLFAEAMWIFVGRKDVRFLTLFNKNMENFSDDGNVFHAPYGFRLRHWSVRSEDKFCEENMHAAQGYDQVEDAIRLLANNPNTRQVVMSIWNPDLDLGCKTKDIPCNDMVMLKIRNGKLITTIQNRSNDLHWGLTTNLFQFSFLTEVMAACLGIELGTQTHNSQSLHVYDWNKTATEMLESESHELYSEVGAKEQRIDFNFSHEVAGNRLREVDCIFSIIMENLERIARGLEEDKEQIESVEAFSKYLYRVYLYLKVYLRYKAAISISKENKMAEAMIALDAINEIDTDDTRDWDVAILVKNWFAKKTNINHEFLGKL